MTKATTYVPIAEASILNTPENAAPELMTAWVRRRLTDLRDTLAAGGWALVSGSPGYPPFKATAAVTVNVATDPALTATGPKSTVIATDLYRMGDDGVEFFVAVDFLLCRGVSTGGTNTDNGGIWFTAVRLRGAWNCDASGLTGQFELGAALDSQNIWNDTASGTTTVQKAAVLPYTIYAASKPGYLVLQYGAHCGSSSVASNRYPRSEAMWVLELVADENGVAYTGNDAALALIAVTPTSGNTAVNSTVPRTRLGLARKVDGQIVDQGSGAVTVGLTAALPDPLPGAGIFAQAYFGSGVGITGTLAHGNPVQLPLAPVLYYNTRPGYSRYLLGIPGADLPNSNDLLAPNPVGGGVGRYVCLPAGLSRAWALNAGRLLVRWE